jgi:hypothetical protein
MSSPIALKELFKAGFEDFVIPSYEDAPFTTIQNRAKVTRSLKAIAGIERVMVKSINRLEKEFGPNGEQVFEADNKDSRIRFVGNWSVDSASNGSYPLTPSTSDVSGFVEITFYGTGLNMLARVTGGATNFVANIDGGSDTANFMPNMSAVLTGRNYSVNIPLNVASGLTLGWHTVRIRKTDVISTLATHGFEILNQRTDLAVYPGAGISQGAFTGLSSLSTSAFNAGISGTKGARVVKYIENGSLSQAVQEVDATAKYLTNTDHTNEEVVRRINFREFGANRADDFSTLAGVGSNRAFTLDDGTTTLVGSNIFSGSFYGTEGVAFVNPSFVTITFTGTGLDIFGGIGPVTGSMPLLVDGVSAGSLNLPSTQTVGLIKICSGLPYGTHTVRLSYTSGSVAFFDFLIYQSKKPSIPAGAFEVADYNVMANFSFGSSITEDTPSAGILRKAHTREFTFVGTWAIAQSTISPTGFGITSSTAGSYAEYTFFGTGFVYKFGNNAAAQSQTVSVNGSTNLSTFTTALSATAGLSFTASTGVITGTPAASIANNQLQVSGLPLGYHKVRVAWTSGVIISPYAFDIITPIHINNPTLKIGSQSLKSAIKYSPEKVQSNVGPDLSKAKAWAVFDGSGQSIHKSYNISAILRNTTGQYTVFFEKQFKDRYYTVSYQGATSQSFISIPGAASGANPEGKRQNSFTFSTTNTTGSVNDAGELSSIIFFGELIDE